MLSSIIGSSKKSAQNETSTTSTGRTASSKTTWQTRFKQAACLGLLSSPLAAAARPIQPSATGTARQLLDNYNPCTENTVFGPLSATFSDAVTFSQTTPAVMGPHAWAQYLCFEGQPTLAGLNATSIPLSYTFGPGTAVNATNGLEQNAQYSVTNDFVLLSRMVGLQTSWEYFQTGVTPQVPNFVFGDSSKTGPTPWTTAGLSSAIDSNYQSHVFVYAYGPDDPDQSWRLSTIAEGLGLKGRGQPGFNGQWNHTIGTFPNDTLSSVTFSNIAPCANVTRMGALDLRAFVDVYGFATGMDANAVIDVDDNFGVGGIVTSSDTNNTLRAATGSTFAAQVYMRDDGLYDTYVGKSIARLAPGSVINNVDISGTNGGIIIGNDQPTTFMNGSRNNDTFVVGQSVANITLNGGFDIIVLPYKASQAYIADMNNHSTIWIVPSNTSSAPKVAAWQSGSSVISAGGPSVFVAKMLPQDVTPLVHYATPMGTNQSSPTQYATCGTQLLPLNITTGGSGGFDPCANIGANGEGGATSLCLSHHGIEEYEGYNENDYNG